MPTNTRGGSNQRIDIVVVGLEWIIFNLFDSTRAETAIPATFNTCPTPILWRVEGDLPLNLCHAGQRTLSRKLRKMDVEIKDITPTEPAGKLKWGPMRRSVARA